MRAGFVDETRFAKKGKKTAGVQRQYCGASGKIDDCVVTVHLGYVPGGFHALADSEVQLTLFGSLHADTLDALRALDIDTLTPLDALATLQRLQRDIRRREGGGG